MHDAVLVAAVIGGAAVVRALLGFGDALLAMPVLSVLVGLRTATPVFGLVSVLGAVLFVAVTWRDMERAAVVRLIVGTALGLPLGVYALRDVPESVVTKLLGAVLIGYAAFALTSAHLPPLSSRWAWPAGFAAGALGGAYNTNGPPVALWATTQRFEPERFRATMQGYFLPSAVLTAGAQGASGLWNGHVFALAAAAVPALVLGLLVGRRLLRYVPRDRFATIALWAMAALGVGLLLR